MRSFILNVKPKENHERKLFTILTARIIAEDSAIVQQEFVTQFVTKFRGRVIQFDGSTFIATFEGPSKAVHCTLKC
jgi:hypothetical protein